ncbi:MAG: glycosyltransferase [Arenicella sp.]
MRMISVLIAAFKADQWLADSLDSIMSQILPEGWQLEILVGADGCDASCHAAIACKNDHMRVISLAHNCGTYVTFNTLMEYAQGELICRFDADDVMREGYLCEQILRLEDVADMTMTWSIYTDPELRPTSYVMAHTHYHPEGGLRRRGSEGQIVIKRHVWDALGGFRAWPCGADTDFSKRAALAGFTIEVIEQFLYYRRTHKNSLTAHPDTNFQSDIRLEIQAETERLEQAYQNLDFPIKLIPITGQVDDIYY